MFTKEQFENSTEDEKRKQLGDLFQLIYTQGHYKDTNLEDALMEYMTYLFDNIEILPELIFDNNGKLDMLRIKQEIASRSCLTSIPSHIISLDDPLQGKEESSNTQEDIISDNNPDNVSPDIILKRQDNLSQEKDLQPFCNYLKALDAKRKNRLFVLYLSFYNQLDSWATRAPSEWPSNLRENFNQKYPQNQDSYDEGKRRAADGSPLDKKEKSHYSRPDYRTKRFFLLNAYLVAHQFMELLKYVFEKELQTHSQQETQSLYTQYYKAAHFTQKPSRDKQTLIKTLFNTPELKKLQQAIFPGFEEAFSGISIYETLANIGEKAQTERDKKILPALNNDACEKRYEADLWELAYKESMDFFEPQRPLGAIKHHLLTCPACKKRLKERKEAISYRIGRFKDLTTAKGLWQRGIYHKHEYNEKHFKRTQQKDAITHYEKVSKQAPCPLVYQLLSKAYQLADKSEKASRVKNKVKDLAVGATSATNDYILAVRCICGIEEQYALNHLRMDKVSLGRQQSDNIQVATINVCPDDGVQGHSVLSRQMLQLIYDKTQKDWFLSVVAVDEEQAKRKGARIMYVTVSKLKEVLDSQMIETNKTGKITCHDIWLKTFETLGDKKVALRDIAGIGLIPLKSEAKLFFKGQEITGINHPVLGKLPFGWYVEVYPRRQNEAFRSYVGKTILSTDESLNAISAPTFINNED